MATYGSYKKLATDQFQDDIITGSKLQDGAGIYNCVKWIYNERGMRCHACANAGNCCEQANGKCCQFTVPANVSVITFELWSGGGGGPGMTCCNCCSFAHGGNGGNYATKTISVCPNWTYTICAGGSWRCEQSHTCTASMGCKSYVNGCNLSNFCVVGGCGGHMCNGDAWGSSNMQHYSTGCANCNICGFWGADFGVMGGAGGKVGQSRCRCNGSTGMTGQAPFIGMWSATTTSENWCTCGCFVNWPAGGGLPGQSSYCGNWAKACGGGAGQGGSGIVKITMG